MEAWLAKQNADNLGIHQLALQRCMIVSMTSRSTDRAVQHSRGFNWRFRLGFGTTTTQSACRYWNSDIRFIYNQGLRCNASLTNQHLVNLEKLKASVHQRGKLNRSANIHRILSSSPFNDHAQSKFRHESGLLYGHSDSNRRPNMLLSRWVRSRQRHPLPGFAI